MDIIEIQELIFCTQGKLQLAVDAMATVYKNLYEGLVAAPEILAYPSKWRPKLRGQVFCSMAYSFEGCVVGLRRNSTLGACIFNLVPIFTSSTPPRCGLNFG